MVTLEVVSALRGACDLLERRVITTRNVNSYAQTWLNLKGWTEGQKAHLIALSNWNISNPKAMATLNLLAAEITYQHAKHIWETLRK